MRGEDQLIQVAFGDEDSLLLTSHAVGDGVPFRYPIAVILDRLVRVAVAQCGGGILCADVDVSPSTMVRRLPKTGCVNRVRSVLMSSRLPQRRPGDAPCSALVLSGARRREISVDNPSSVRLCGAHGVCAFLSGLGWQPGADVSEPRASRSRYWKRTRECPCSAHPCVLGTGRNRTRGGQRLWGLLACPFAGVGESRKELR